MNPKLLTYVSKDTQKKMKNAMIKYQKNGKQSKYFKRAVNYFLWLHHYLATGKINIKKGIIYITK